MLVVGPLKKPHAVVGSNELLDLWKRLTHELPGYVAWSDAPVVDVLGAMHVREPLGFVTANVDLRPYELAVLNCTTSAVVDVASGRIFSRSLAESEFGTLHDIALRTALVQPEPGENPIVKELVHYADNVVSNWDSANQSFAQMGLPPRVLKALSSKWERVRQETAARLIEPRANEVSQWISACVAPMRTDDVAYVAASFANGTITGAAAILPDGRFVPPGEPFAVLKFVMESSGNARWFAPQALEIQRAMDQTLGVSPKLFEDPSVQAHVLHPDDPPGLEEIAPCLSDAPRRVRDALNDSRREGFSLNPEDLGQVVRLLPQSRVDLRAALDSQNLLTLVDEDVTPSLAVIGRIERRGMQISVPAQGWLRFRDTLTYQLINIAARASEVLGSDATDISDAELVRALRREGPMPLLPPKSSQKDLISRYRAAGSQLAADVAILRSVKKTEKWLEHIEQAPGYLQGRMRFGTTGRLHYSKLALHSLPKEGLLAGPIRSQLVAPAGWTLIAADWNSFEPRILASLLGPTSDIYHAAQHRDLYQALTTVAHMSRGEVKAALLAILYGQSQRGFVAAQHQLDPNHARFVFKSFNIGFPELKIFRTRQLDTFAHGKQIRTAGGWRRMPTEKQRTRVPHLPVQGLGAELLRFAIRELDERLVPFGAFIVHQQHDEIVVLAPNSVVDQVKDLLVEVMEHEASVRLPNPVPLPVRIKTGQTWKDLL